MAKKGATSKEKSWLAKFIQCIYSFFLFFNLKNIYVIFTTLLTYLLALDLDLGDVWLLLRFSGSLASERDIGPEHLWAPYVKLHPCLSVPFFIVDILALAWAKSKVTSTSNSKIIGSFF